METMFTMYANPHHLSSTLSRKNKHSCSVLSGGSLALYADVLLVCKCELKLPVCPAPDHLLIQGVTTSLFPIQQGLSRYVI